MNGQVFFDSDDFQGSKSVVLKQPLTSLTLDELIYKQRWKQIMAINIRADQKRADGYALFGDKYQFSETRVLRVTHNE